MLKDHSQLRLSLSPYQGLYDAIIPANHLLRRIKSKQGYLQQRKRLNPEVFSDLNDEYLADFYCQ